MRLSKEGKELLKTLEGCKLKAYKDQAGVWTIGYGHIRGVFDGMICTQAEADAWLTEDVSETVYDVQFLVDVPINQNQFDALVLFTFNLGSDIDSDTKAEGLGDSTLLKKLNAGDYKGAATEFPKWIYAGGKKNNGLIKRRSIEQTLFLKEV